MGILTTTKTKVCSRCGRELPLTEFYKNDSCADGHIGQCKKCKNEIAKIRINRVKANQGKGIVIPPPPYSQNPEYADKSPRELQDSLRKLKQELIARGFNCDIKLTYLKEITI